MSTKTCWEPNQKNTSQKEVRVFQIGFPHPFENYAPVKSEIESSPKIRGWKWKQRLQKKNTTNRVLIGRPRKTSLEAKQNKNIRHQKKTHKKWKNMNHQKSFWKKTWKNCFKKKLDLQKLPQTPITAKEWHPLKACCSWKHPVPWLWITIHPYGFH